MDIEFQQLANELDCTELELRVIYMVRSASGEVEQRRAPGEAPIDLMKRVELKRAREIIKTVRLHTAAVPAVLSEPNLRIVVNSYIPPNTIVAHASMEECLRVWRENATPPAQPRDAIQGRGTTR